MSTNLEQTLLAACREYAEAHAEWVEGRTEDPSRQEAAHRAIVTLGEAGRKTEPTTFAELEAAGWVSYPAALHPWLDSRIGDNEVTVYREGYVHLATDDAAEPLPEADACRLAHRLAEVLRSFTPTGG